jgi:transposase
MGEKSGPVKEPAEQVVKAIRRATRRQFSAEEKIRIVLSGLRGEDSIAELCRREGIAQNLYYRWSKEFLEAGKKRLAGDTARAATSDEVKDLRREASALKEVVAELMLENRLLKKSTLGAGERSAAPFPPAARTARSGAAPRAAGHSPPGSPARAVHQASARSPSARSQSGVRQRPRISSPGRCVPDALSAPAVRIALRDQWHDPQLTRNRRALPQPNTPFPKIF